MGREVRTGVMLRNLLDCMMVILASSWQKPGPEVIKLFTCSTHLSMNFILLINVKMPTIVGILTFISMINTTSERLKARNLHLSIF